MPLRVVGWPSYVASMEYYRDEHVASSGMPSDKFLLFFFIIFGPGGALQAPKRSLKDQRTEFPPENIEFRTR